MASYLCVLGKNRIEYIIQKSKFIATCFEIESVEDATNKLAEVKKEFADATHNCYAYILKGEQNYTKYSDDGEPQGTAGLPILETIKAKELMNVLVVVTRYFGGIKLGTGGLVRAYTESTVRGLNEANVVSNEFSCFYKVVLDFTIYSKIQKVFYADEVALFNTEYSDCVTLEIAVKEESSTSFLENLSELTLGKANTELIKKDYYAFNIK